MTGHCWPILSQETLKHSGASQAQSLWGFPGVHKVLFEFSEHLWWVWGLILNSNSPLQLSCWGYSFALGCEISFVGGIQHSSVDACPAASCNFGILAGDEWMFFYSDILEYFIYSMNRQKDTTLKGELPRSVGAQYATGEEWRNNSRRKQEMEPKRKQCPVVDMTGDGSQVLCWKKKKLHRNLGC